METGYIVFVFVCADLFAIWRLIMYGGWAFITWREQSVAKQSEVGGGVRPEGTPARAGSGETHWHARRALGGVAVALALNILAMAFWLSEGTPLSTCVIALVIVTIGTSVALVVVMVWLEKLRRLYRPSWLERPAAGH